MISEVTAVKLREWRESDLPFLKVMRNNVALQAQLLAVAKGSDDAAVRAWLARRTEGTEQTFRVIAEPASNRPMGYLQAELANKRIEGWSFGICLDEPFQNQGYGTAALIALERELADKFGARHIKLEVDSANARAIRCYERLGYLEYGVAAREMMIGDEARMVISLAKPLDDNGNRP